MRPMKFGVGQAVRRVEDVRFVTGTGRYTDDIAPAGQLHAVMVRSPYASATLHVGDLAAVRAMPGVKLVLAAGDVEALGPMPCLGPARNADGTKMGLPTYPVIATDRVRHVGDVVGMVVAQTLAQAREAADAFPAEYEAEDAIVGIAGAEAQDAKAVWPEFGTNLAYDASVGDAPGTQAAFAKADRVVSLTLVNNRLVTNYLEPRACLAEIEEGTGRLVLTVGSQGSHDVRDVVARVMGRDAATIRVVTPDVGGGFGTKLFTTREYPLCAFAAERLGAPVKWAADRGEHFVGDSQGRDNRTLAEMALDADGRFLAMRVTIDADMGAYLSQFAPSIPVGGAYMTPGAYDIPVVHARIRGWYTNTVPVDAYRGAGRPEAAYVVERLVDHIAREIGTTPDALRAKNFIRPEQMPYRTATGRTYDSGEFEAHLRGAMEIAGWEGFEARAAEARERGKARGIGLASYIEACASGSPEDAMVRIEPDGTALVTVGTQSSGQGHLTAYAQLVSQHLDLPVEKIRVLQGDTDVVATGGGTGGSRSIPVGGAAVAGASELVANRLRELASEALEASAADLEIAEGTVRVAGTDRAIGFAELAAKAPDGIAATHGYKPPAATYPNGTHVCEVEVDPDTGTVDVVAYSIVDDFGVTLNPLLLAGQVHGGVVQGIGQALQEHVVYDEGGQLVTASFMDYQMPRAADVPNFVFETRNVPCATNVLGVKGAGEAGTIGAAPAVMNALVDALARGFGVTHIDMPATPQAVFAAIHRR
ncbi:xanthine dehydrogenase family protein molybdopterin-binding subunit [Salinarimonas ramus]|uniref:Carbon monoxide dehydrogenase n=1 Tax=Salinarimonas ramus TaxID=690164 RepID=A0A917V1Q3_9HYPH|nr:xanthine dehydrogenase family protein molybdopterin-binding subunit [Salinarimonas ramus]GGK21537.1 carbon monoxide dehydrogenase [Salinarimonas ramus]